MFTREVSDGEFDKKEGKTKTLSSKIQLFCILIRVKLLQACLHKEFHMANLTSDNDYQKTLFKD
jgi:hypothetical protein